MIPLFVIVTEEGTAVPEQYEFLKSPVRIGRSDLNDLPLRQPFVSTFHARIEFDDGEANYTDLGSTNGSRLDGESLAPNVRAPLRPGAEVRIPDAGPEPGTFKLTFARKPLGAHAPRAVQMTAFAMRAASLVGVAPAQITKAKADARATPPEVERAPPAVALPPDPVSEQAAAEALGAAALELDLSYASYRGSWEHLSATIDTAIANLQGPARAVALRRMAAQYPELSAEPQFLAMLSPGAPAPNGAAAPADRRPALPASEPLVAGSATAGEDALRLVRVFCEEYLPASPDQLGSADVQAVLDRVASAIEAFARSFIELQRGHEEFGKDMGLRTVAGEGALARAADARQLLTYVLDPRASGRDRELQRAFGDFMIHQVALLRGVVEGAQALLARVSPEAISAEAPQSRWPMRAQALWKAFEERYHELADDGSAVSEVLFGKEFARAYYAMAGERGPDEPSRDPRAGTRALRVDRVGENDEDGDAP